MIYRGIDATLPLSSIAATLSSRPRASPSGRSGNPGMRVYTLTIGDTYETSTGKPESKAWREAGWESGERKKASSWGVSRSKTFAANRINAGI